MNINAYLQDHPVNNLTFINVGKKMKVKIEFAVGSCVTDAVKQLIKLANETNITHYGDFNEINLIANPGDNFNIIYTPYKVRDERYKEQRAQKEKEDAFKQNAKLANISKITNDPPSNMVFNNKGTWQVKFDLYLITAKQLNALPDGTCLYSIMGKKVIVGVDDIDNDTRGGFLAFGFKKIDVDYRRSLD